MGKSRRRPGGGISQMDAAQEPTPIGLPPGLPTSGLGAEELGWLRQFLTSAALGEHFEEASAWVVQTGCIQKDLEIDGHLQELCDHLSLKTFPARRLRIARDELLSRDCAEDAHSCISTVASIAEEKVMQIGTVTSTKPGVALPTDDQLQLKPDLLADSRSPEKLSKSAKKRERKQIRDAAYAASGTAAQAASEHSMRMKAKQIDACTNNRAADDHEAARSTWSVTREGCKDRAELFLPTNFVGWVIGKNGATIKHIERTYLVTAQVVSQTVSVCGKRERVKQAVAYINQLLSGAIWF